MGGMKQYGGGCHCGAIRFTFQGPERLSAIDCNCSICAKTAYLHVIVDGSDFQIEAGMDHLTVYTFNTGAAKHQFCDVCGIKPFYVPRSHPDGYSVNARCIDDIDIDDLDIEPFDGQNWEASIDSIR